MNNYNLPSETYMAQIEKVPQGDEQSLKDNVINQVLGDRLDVLRIILFDISSEVRSRKYLTSSLIDKIDKDICEIKGELYEIETWAFGRSRTIDIRRNHIEKKIAELKKEKRDKETERWRDIAPLKKEFRERFKEYKSVLRNFNLIANNNFMNKQNGNKESKNNGLR